MNYRSRSNVSAIALLGLAVAACRAEGVATPDGAITTGTDSGRDATATPDTSVVTPGTDGGTDRDTGSVSNPDVISNVQTYSIRSIQDRSDAMHPAQNTHVALDPASLVTLTGRVLTSGASGSSSGLCRFSVWVGSPASGDYTGVQIQEAIAIGDAGSCFDVPAHLIPSTLVPGTAVTAASDLRYTEFCQAGSGVDAGTCESFAVTELTTSATTVLTFGSAGAAPTPATVTAADIGQNGSAVGPRTIALEGSLVQIQNAHVRITPVSGMPMYPDVSVVDSAGGPLAVGLNATNFTHASCVRAVLLNGRDPSSITTATDGPVLTSVTGILTPSFGRWVLQLRADTDLNGTACIATDAGTTATDAGSAPDATTHD